jgi:formamidopyrimidine-DNA glycosylase
MPELPEVETVRRILVPIVKGKKIAAIDVIRPKNIVSGAAAFKASLVGESFLDVGRKGKYLIFFLTHDKVVISHLRMEGKYYEGKVSDTPDKFDLLIYQFSDGTTLRYNDVRKFGVIQLTDKAHYLTEDPLVKLGKEPWELTPEELLQGLHAKHSQTIKEALLDQTLIAGLGNIYDDEVLFASKISPLLPSNQITSEQAATLLKEARRILEEAIAAGGSTIRSYHPEAGVDGLMQNELLAYGKGNTPCPNCGFPLRRITIGGRGTVYCPKCQANPGHPLIVGVTGPIASGKSSVTRYLVERGYEKIDADEIVAQLYQKSAIQHHLQKMFGDAAISDGQINRPYLLKLFADKPRAKARLEHYLYPRVYAEIDKRIATSNSTKIVLDIPLLLHSPFEEKCDLIIYIHAEKDTQIARLVERGKDPETSLALNAHYPRGLAKKAAGIVLDGNHSLTYLENELSHYSYLFDK